LGGSRRSYFGKNMQKKNNKENITQGRLRTIAVLSLEQVILYAKMEKDMGRALTKKEIKNLFGGMVERHLNN
jgi:chromosome segregation and condensation protein ScpB